MGVVDDVIDVAKDVADSIGQKADKVAAISKLKIKIARTNSDIRSAYEKLGRTVYSLSDMKYENNELVGSVIEEIKTLSAELADLKGQLAKLRNRVLCPCCSTYVPQESSYCSKCGNKLKQDFPSDQQENDGESSL